MVPSLLEKRKFQHFIYVHSLLLLGLLLIQPSWNALLVSLIIFLFFLAPVFSVVNHLNFAHHYIEFKNKFSEWAAIIFLAVYSFWQLQDVKSYHILHHKNWKTTEDPTSKELHQGWLKYYIGNTNPCAINLVDTNESACIKIINKYFYTIKLSVYTLLFIIGGIELLWYTVFLMQFFIFFFTKLHDIIFHHSDLATNKPWLFPIYFNDSWHVDHHTKYNELESWKWPLVNPHFWVYKLLFKSN